MRGRSDLSLLEDILLILLVYSLSSISPTSSRTLLFDMFKPGMVVPSPPSFATYFNGGMYFLEGACSSSQIRLFLTPSSSSSRFLFLLADSTAAVCGCCDFVDGVVLLESLPSYQTISLTEYVMWNGNAYQVAENSQLLVLLRLISRHCLYRVADGMLCISKDLRNVGRLCAVLYNSWYAKVRCCEGCDFSKRVVDVCCKR